MRTYIPFSGMSTDTGMFGNHVIRAHMIPLWGGLRPKCYVKTASSLVPTMGYYRGLHSHVNDLGQARFILATDQGAANPGLYLMNIDNTPASRFATDVTRVGGYDTSSSYGWQFTSFGPTVVGTNGVDAIQSRDVRVAADDTSATNFGTMITTTAPSGSSLPTGNPRAKFVGWIKNHLVLGNFNLTVGTYGAPPLNDVAGVPVGGAYGALLAQDYPMGVWWSSTDNITRFASPATHPMIIGSDYQLLYDDYGPITGLTSGEWILIFKERAIYRMTGPPFSFDLVSGSIGCRQPNSIVKTGEDVYFWSDNGPAVVRGGQQVVLLAENKIDSYIKYYSKVDSSTYVSTEIGKTVNSSPLAVCGTVDQANGLVMWTFNGFAWVCMSMKTGEFTLGPFAQYASTGTNGPVVNVDINEALYTGNFIGTSAYVKSYSATHAGLDDDALYCPNKVVVLMGEVPAAYNFGLCVPTKSVHAGASLKVIGSIKTAAIRLDPNKSSRIVGVRPSISGYPSLSSDKPVVSVTVTSTSNQLGSWLYGASSTYTSANSYGWINTPGTQFADYNTIEISFSTGDFDRNEYGTVHGIDVEYELGGVVSYPGAA